MNKWIIVLMLFVMLIPAVSAQRYFRIIGKASQRCLDVAMNGTANRTNVWIYEWNEINGGAAQLWRLEPAGGGYYRIIGKASQKCLDVALNGTANQTNVWIYERNDINDGAAQLWRFEEAQ